ncbi:MAG TPA: PrpF domain-containing protein, partial [Burkholderiales bacterium]|nr:PrpF domain-containing protein [Burkholderiales bacterium]
IGPPTRPDADVDYTFAQVLVDKAHVDYSALCGNMTSAVGPYAVDQGMLSASGTSTSVRIHNTNTNKVIVAHFPVEDGVAAVDGDLEIPGVAGTGAPLRLDFLDPGGASTGKLLPTGKVIERLDVPGVGEIEASLIDASNACVFVRAQDLGISGRELPDEIDKNRELMAKLSAIRVAASMRMGLAKTEAEALKKTTVPFVAFVTAPVDTQTLSAARIPGSEVDLVARAISNGQPHRALPLGVSMCMAAAARLTGSVVHQATRPEARDSGDIRIAMPSGVLRVAAEVALENGNWKVLRGGFYRTQRRLFEGNLLVRASALE